MIKKLILKQCEAFEITPKEIVQIDLTAIIVAIASTLSIRPLFELVVGIIQL